MSRRGFTLIEMLVVIAIIGVLAALVAVWIVNTNIQAKNAATVARIHLLDAGCSDYRREMGEYPPMTYAGSKNLHWYLGQPWTVDRNGITRQVGPFTEFRSGWLAPGASVHPVPAPSFVYDKFEQPIEYLNPGAQNPNGVDIWSPGYKPGPGDDLTNWQPEY